MVMPCIQSVLGGVIQDVEYAILFYITFHPA